jgi:hypothetical protein
VTITATWHRCSGDPACAWRARQPFDCGQHADSGPDVFSRAAELGIDLQPDGRGRDHDTAKAPE